jgi:hypothetical protein
MSTESPGFWSGGQEAYLEYLRREEEREVAELERRYDREQDDRKRKEILRQIEIVMSRYEARRDESGRCWY